MWSIHTFGTRVGRLNTTIAVPITATATRTRRAVANESSRGALGEASWGEQQVQPLHLAARSGHATGLTRWVRSLQCRATCASPLGGVREAGRVGEAEAIGVDAEVQPPLALLTLEPREHVHI